MTMRDVDLRVYSGSDARRWRDQFVSFEIEKTKGRAPNKGKIEIYNLSLDSVRFIEGAEACALFVDGSALYVGDIARRLVVTRQDGPTRITEISAGSGRAAIVGARVALSYPAGVRRSVAITDAVQAMGIATRGAVPDDGATLDAGWAFSGKASAVLDELAPGWSVQDNAIDFGQDTGRTVLRIAEGTGLIGAPERTDKGINVNIVLRPEVSVHTIIALESRFVTGYYRVREVRHRGDSRGGEWRTECACTGV